MHGHPLKPFARKGAARILAERVEAAITRGWAGRMLAAFGRIGRDRGQRVLVFGRALGEVALGSEDLPRRIPLAVQGDVLGFARELARRTGGTWRPGVEGAVAATLRLPGATLEFQLLEGGVLGFLSRAETTFDALGYDLTEPGTLHDAWGGLDDAAHRRLVPGPGVDLEDPARALGLLGLELEHRLEPSPRLAARLRTLGTAEAMAGVDPLRFWSAFDPHLGRWASSRFADGRLGAVLTAFLVAREVPVVSVPPDLPFLVEVERLEDGLAARQVQDSGSDAGCGLPGAVRLLGLLARRLGLDRLPPPGTEPRFSTRGLAGALGRSDPGVGALARVAGEAGRLAALGFPVRVEGPPKERPDRIRASGALLAAALAEAHPRDGTVAVLRPEPVGALIRLLGVRRPRAA